MKTKLLIISVFILGAFASCERYLETNPKDFTSPENYFNTAQELNSALTGVYDALGQDGTFGRNLVIELAHGSDEGFYKRDGISLNATPMVYFQTPSDPVIISVWRQLYIGINRANYLLANIDKPLMDSTARNIIKGEALFLRGFMYFQLAHLYGEVPLILTPTVDGDKVDNPKKPLAEVYAQILKDMTDAELLVNTYTKNGFPGRVSKTAVQGVLARVCLKMAGEPLKDVSKYVDAKIWAEKVISSGVHSLNPSYKQVFINHSQDLYDFQFKESIWEIEFFGNNTTTPEREGGRFANQLAIRNSVIDRGYGYATVGATATLYRKYQQGDLRRDWNISTFRYSTGASSIGLGDTVALAASAIHERDAGKWRRYFELVNPKSQDWSPTNFPVLRYSDVLLMYVEAAIELNDPSDASSVAYKYFNQVRRRAYGFTATGVAPPGLERIPTRQEIRDERTRELCFEALRKFDLIRWGNFIQTMKTVGQDINLNAPTTLKYAVLGYNNVSQKHVILPIPSQELSLNKALKQNSLW